MATQLGRVSGSRVATARRSGARRSSHRHLAASARAEAPKLIPWPVMQSYLTESKQKSVELTDIPELQAEGYTLVDIRPKEDYAEYHAPGAVNVELFRDITGWSMRRLAFLANGIKGTEEDPEFMDNVEKAVGGKDKKVMVICESGGSYLAIGGSLEGRRSRSLQAVYKLKALAGFEDVLHCYDGMRGWAKKGLPMEGEDVAKWKERAGSTPGA